MFETLKPENASINLWEIGKALRDGYATVRNRFELATANSDGYRSSYKITLDSGESESFVFENPVGSETNVLVSRLVIGADGTADIDTIRNPDFSGGSDVTINNRLIPSSQTEEVNSFANFKSGVSLSNGYGSLPSRIFGSQQGISKTSGSDSAEYSLNEGASFGVTITSRNSSNNIVIKILFEEE